MDHKRNGERIQNLRQGKVSGLLASNSGIVSIIEDRIGSLHVDSIEKRKMNASISLAEEAGFVTLFAGIYQKLLKYFKNT